MNPTRNYRIKVEVSDPFNLMSQVVVDFYSFIHAYVLTRDIRIYNFLHDLRIQYEISKC
jgi:hypothetical protein